ncbi:MAG: 30S ribosomal protein S27ae [Thaumarchaeota archaeon]|nr:30S ribosomal protein S27ae [Nitrososphaerota archaeon]
MADKKKAAKSTGVAAYYKIVGDNATKIRKICSRCGKGVFMSEHKNRKTCGKCGLTEFNQ